MAAFAGLWVTVLAMRWDRLFADLEADAVELAKSETDLLAADLSDDTWAETSWRQLMGGAVTVDVVGVGHLSGQVASINDTLIRLQSEIVDLLIATAAVVEVVSTQDRSEPPSRIDAALGWPAALRRLRDADESLRFTLRDGRLIRGRVAAIGQDFVRVEVESGRLRVVVLDALATVAPDV